MLNRKVILEHISIKAGAAPQRKYTELIEIF